MTVPAVDRAGRDVTPNLAGGVGPAMALRQRIIPSRRDYNRWVADQTLEDYALRFTAVSARRWGAGQVANTALGATSFLALEAIGGGITLRYGFANAAAAILAVGLLIFATGAADRRLRRALRASISTCSPAAPASATSARP